jgi:hypothetical protein
MGSSFGSILGGLAGGSIGSAVVNLRLDDKAYQSGLKSAEAQTAATTNSMGTAFGKFKAVAGIAAVAAGAALLKFGADAVKAAVEANEAMIRLQNTLANNPKLADTSAEAIANLAEEIRKMTGVDDDAIVSMASVLGQFDLTGRQVEQLIPLIVDLSAKMGIDLDAAAKAVGKSATGSTGALARYGIAVDSADTKSAQLTNTIEGLSKVQGFAAEKAKAEPWILLSSTFDEFKEDIGRSLIPALTSLTELMIDLEPVLQLVGFLFKGVALDVSLAIAAIEDAKQSGVEFADTMLGPLYNATTTLDTGTSHVAQTLDRFTQGVQVASTATDEGGDHVRQYGFAFERFNGLTASALKDFRENLEDSLNVADDVLSRLSEKAKVTANDILKAFIKQIAAQKEYEANILRLKERNIPDDVLAQLTDLGLGGAKVIAALADAADQKFDKIIAKMRLSGETARNTADDIASVGSAISNLHDKTISITVNRVTHRGTAEGGIIANAAGGILAGANGFVTRHPTFLVGEGNYSTFAGRGAEAVIPLNERGIGILSEALKRAIGETGGRRGGDIHFHGDVWTQDGDHFARKVMAALNGYMDRSIAI